jgi:altronate dehydratase small subunit
MSRVLVISERDNVATALDPLQAGERIETAGHSVVVREAIPSGHKVALTRIASGDVVVKYGSAIGTATADISPGSHVHVHNLAGARGRGDLSAT